MEHVKRSILCGVCGATAPEFQGDVDNEDRINPPMMPGWLTATVMRTVRNPDYEPEDVDAVVSRMTSNVPGGPEEKAAVMGFMRPLAEAMVGRQEVGPAFIVEEVDVHLCPDHASDLFKLDTEAFVAAGWEGI